MHFRISGADADRLQAAMGDIVCAELDNDQGEVVNQINSWKMRTTIDDDNVVYVAEGSESDHEGSLWEFRGIVTLSRTPNGWYLNDLISLGGVGGSLTREAFKHVRNNPVADHHSGKLYLLSLNAKSDSFWLKMGFAFNGRLPATRSTANDPIPMSISLNAPQQNPVAPDLTGLPPISRSRSASASGSTPPLKGSFDDL